MSTDPTVLAELERIPRGDLAQNIYRMAYANARAHSLGARSTLAASPDAAERVALEAVRRHYPDFVPASRD